MAHLEDARQVLPRGNAGIQPLNRAYALLLASEFQGFCRDLHSECSDAIVATLNVSHALESVMRQALVGSRHLDRGNANTSNLQQDFARLGFDLWSGVGQFVANVVTIKADLEELNQWRNAIAHEDYTRLQQGGRPLLKIRLLRRWSSSIKKLAIGMDRLAGSNLKQMLRKNPW